ncbi:MAG: type II secretion system major pseudopilin GspG [Chromatiales bacterium]|nr:type II secretion system major pseudopilin GspG [Chromatiales bacterium]
MRKDVRPAKPARMQGFTLIEIMVVVVILGILAALIAPNVINRIDDAQSAKVRQDIRAIESALKLYRLDNFRYPTSDQGLQALVTPPSGSRKGSAGSYLDRMPKDPWDRPYVYENPGKQGEFDIYTLGRDGAPGGEGPDADVGNWTLE